MRRTVPPSAEIEKNRQAARRRGRRRRARGSALGAREARRQADHPARRRGRVRRLARSGPLRAKARGRARYLALKRRGLSHPRASMTIARKLARRCFHTLRELGPEALEPVTYPRVHADRFRQAQPLPDGDNTAGQLPRLSRLPPEGGDPTKNERPESFPTDRPINHPVAGLKAEHPAKPGRPRNDRTDQSPTAPQPLAPAP